MTKFIAQHVPYRDTNAFTPIAIDYVSQSTALRPFYTHAPTIEGVQDAIVARNQFPTNREALVAYLQGQYAGMGEISLVQANIESLLSENTYTITTAHQPNIFTGHLYFIYKIHHTIRLAAALKTALPGNHFVPVYYMGSEDADLEELGEVNINGKKYTWQTKQGGAVGRMKIDKSFIEIIDAIDSQLSVEPHGKEIMHTLRKIYTLDKTIEKATFEFVHELFASYGLVILLPDHPALKKLFAPVIKKELLEQFSHREVAKTVGKFPHEYKVQAAGRAINMFYLEEGMRERIEQTNGAWSVVNTEASFNEDAILAELEQKPERFSPNVILRPVFQEQVLPNIIFVGGGGELAYWLELKRVFEAAGVPFPVMVLRNSFMLAPAIIGEKINALGLETVDFFKSTQKIIELLVKKGSVLQLDLANEKNELLRLYNSIGNTAAKIDSTLDKHVQALYAGISKKIAQLEKKMLKAEKKKFESQQRQVEKIKGRLFPGDNLQERVDNILPWYARYGRDIIDIIYENSLALEQEFCILSEQDNKAL